MGFPAPSISGGQLFGATSQFTQLPDGSLLNMSFAQQIRQDNSNIVLVLPNGNNIIIPYQSATLASAALTGITDFLTAQFSLLTVRSITPATAANGSTVNAVLIGTGFQYDILTGVFTGSVKIGTNAATVTYVNSNTLLLNFTAPAPPGTYNVVYTPTVGGAVTLVNGWTSS